MINRNQELMKLSSELEYGQSLVKVANLNYEPVKNEPDSNIFKAPKLEMPSMEQNEKPKERKMTHHKGKAKPAYTHELKSNSPYQTN